jgi:hypothetical protein
VQHYLADSLGSYFGPEYIMFVEPPEGAKPMIECRYDEQPDGSVIWTMTYRRTPEAKAVEIPSRKSPQSTAINLNPPPESFRVQFWRLIFNTTPPGLHQQPAPVTDGDW